MRGPDRAGHRRAAGSCGGPGGGSLGRGAPPRAVAGPDAGTMARPRGALHRQWWLQDRVWHGTESRRGDGRPGSGRPRVHTARVQGRGVAVTGVASMAFAISATPGSIRAWAMEL